MAKKRKERKKSKDEEMEARLERLDSQFVGLEKEAKLTDVLKALAEVESNLGQLPATLATLRKRGYIHGRLLERKLASCKEQWLSIRPRVEEARDNYLDDLDVNLDEADDAVGGAEDSEKERDIKQAESVIQQLRNSINEAKSSLSGMYDEVENALNEVSSQLDKVAWMLDQVEASAIVLREDEGPLHAVKAQWLQDGDDEGPSGSLFLTDQRLLFEQKEKIATKKFLFVTTESEEVQKLLLDIPVSYIDKIEHSEEGGFLGMGKDDMLDLIFSAQAPITRARFHIKGQDSSDWAVWLKQIQTGQVHEDRIEKEALSEDEVKGKRFPERCPSCFAAVPPQPRGVTVVQCEFCDATINPMD